MNYIIIGHLYMITSCLTERESGFDPGERKRPGGGRRFFHKVLLIIFLMHDCSRVALVF